MVFSFLRKYRERKQERRGKIIETQARSEPVENDMAWFFPPCDVHDHSVWDRYWQDQLSHGLSPPWFDMFCDDTHLIECLIRRGAKELLCAGNGISQEPRALAAAGFEVTAIDMSPVAADIAQTWHFSSKELDTFCHKEQRAPGGTATFVVGDILNRSECPGPFDAIIERRTLQLFPEEERGVALDALALRLKPEGMFLSHCHDGAWKPPSKPVHQVEHVFRGRGWSIVRRPPDHHGRTAWLTMSTG